jgi:hypothetical protein
MGHYIDNGGGAIWNSLAPDTEYCYRAVPHNEYGSPADGDIPEVCATTDTNLRDLVTPLPSWSGLTDGCPTYTYLGNAPGGNDKPDWSEQAQGVANDGEYWFFTHEKKLFKYAANWREVDGDDIDKIDSTGFPPEMSSRGMDHFGDLDHYGGYLFVPLEDNKPKYSPNNPAADINGFVHASPYTIIAVFRASDLAFVDWMDVTEYQRKLGWVAIDPVERILYSTESTLDANTPLVRYTVVLENIGNEDEDFLIALDQDENDIPIYLVESNGLPLIGKYTYMQGGVFSPWGDLYLSVGKAGDSADNVHGGIHLFRRTEDGSTFKRIHSSVNLNDAAPGIHMFAYEYHPQNNTFGGLGEEPEGIDWWNRDNISGSRYSGQLHAILLDNQLGVDDRIWLKHYRVDYSCVKDNDSDGDGVSDGDEVYLYNTHPQLLDSDQDGLEDNIDNCPLMMNPDQTDLDGDGQGDPCDPFVNGDGLYNAVNGGNAGNAGSAGKSRFMRTPVNTGNVGFRR